MNDVIISLATYNRRLPKIKQTLPMIISQKCPYKKIIINVQDDCNNDEFRQFEEFKKLSDKIEVVKRPAKWRALNKIIYTYREYPDDIIITCDDDIFYDDYLFSALLDMHTKHPECIIAHEINPVIIENDGKIRTPICVEPKLLQVEFGKYMTGCCLFPPHIFDGSSIRIDDYDRFIELTDGVNDEIWLWTLSTLLGVQCIGLNYTYSFDLDCAAMPPEDFALSNINGKKDVIAEFDYRLNTLYGKSLVEKMLSKPIVIYVNRDNFSGVLANANWINRTYKNFYILFVCNPAEIRRSQVYNILYVYSKLQWGKGIRISHPMMNKWFERGTI